MDLNTFVCGCLNVKVKISVNFSDIKYNNLNLAEEEAIHPYFKQGVYALGVNLCDVIEEYPRLLRSNIVGSWNIRKCLICRMFTHATNFSSGVVTCSKAFVEEPTDPNITASTKGLCYSQVYEIYLPLKLKNISARRDVEIQNEEIERFLTERAMFFLEEHLISAEEKKEKEIIEKRIEEEKIIILELLKLEQEELDTTPTVSPTNTPCRLTAPVSFDAPSNNAQADPAIQTFSVPIDAHVIEEEMMKLQLQVTADTVPIKTPLPLHSIGIFEMDGFESSNVDPKRSISDSESDDEEFEVHTSRPPMLPVKEVACSAPVNIPYWPIHRMTSNEQFGDDKDENPSNLSEIAVSMRHLTSTVRMSSADILGDRPSRRMPFKL